jgi:hypothetical protein
MFPTRKNTDTAVAVVEPNPPVHDANSLVLDAVSRRLGPIDKWQLNRDARAERREATKAITAIACKALVEDSRHDITHRLQDSKRRREAEFAQHGESLMVQSLENRDRTSMRLTGQQEQTAEVIETAYDEKLAWLEERLASGNISQERYAHRRTEFERNRDELLADSQGARRMMTDTLNASFVSTNSPEKLNSQ